jgi:hypothetical protein
VRKCFRIAYSGAAAIFEECKWRNEKIGEDALDDLIRKIYADTLPGTSLSRPNRFIAYAEVNGQTIVARVKNTGRCKELLVPGASVILQKSANPERKTKAKTRARCLNFPTRGSTMSSCAIKPPLPHGCASTCPQSVSGARRHSSSVKRTIGKTFAQ